VLDADGGAFSATTTVNLAWGSHVMTSEYGIILNNQMGK
jgi:gamma-glutamyltranspeptidase